ncbi:MAG: hypothetical protein HY270_13565 [Deltaproteobacteria bacterium]|nr:hypothetical protein [Deltaproteobacteria bacterium]
MSLRLSSFLTFLVLVLSAEALRPSAASAVNTVYLMNDDHVDYGWNDRVPNYEPALLNEIDYYRARVDVTAAAPLGEQTHFNTDGWFAVWLYQQNRSNTQFQDLLAKMRSGNITAPLNPMVTLYGALSTEGAIRSGYYPGKLQRQYGVPFLMAQDMENATSPWGIASIWAGSGAKYTWKGLCGCSSAGTYANRTDEVFLWQGPDNKTLLMKWYFLSSTTTWGGYAEARDNLSQAAIQNSINHFSVRPPNVPLTGLFGAGWDDVTWLSSQFEPLAQQWNTVHPGGDQVRVSNGVDYFLQLENFAGSLNTLRGGWGNEWDLAPASLAERTSQTRRAIEELHTAEGLSAIVHAYDPSRWPAQQAAVESAMVDYGRYYEHTWGSVNGVPLSSVVSNKKLWAQHVEDAVAGAHVAAAASFAALFTTPGLEDRFVVFNPLGFARTDYADLPVASVGPYVVTDVTSNTEVASQVVNVGGSFYLRILASSVPSFGYRMYSYRSGTGVGFAAAASFAGGQMSGDRYRVALGARGQLTSVVDLSNASRELAGANALNDFGAGSGCSGVAENVGPVSASMVCTVSGLPSRRVRVTLIRNVNRVEIENEILQNYTSAAQYRYHFNLDSPQIRFEEVGAIARPGFVPTGDFLPGARTDYVTLNHFASFATAAYTATLSNADAYLMQVGNSSVSSFDLSTPQVKVLASGAIAGSDISDQGGDAYVLTRFALSADAAAYDGPSALRTSLAHQNRLEAIALSRGQNGPLAAASAGFLSVSPANVVVTAFKPAEESNRGWIVRLWELSGTPASVSIDASSFAPGTAAETTLIETDVGAVPISGGVINAAIGANEIKTFRFGNPLPSPSTASPTPSSTATRTITRTSTSTPTSSPTPVPATYTATAAATPTSTPSNSPPPTTTGTPTPARLSGVIRYQGSGIPVPDVDVPLLGPLPQDAITLADGSFSLTASAAQNWHFAPHKNGIEKTAITALDAAMIQQAAVGLRSLTPAQRLACDSNGNGSISSIDATYILQYRVALLSMLPVAKACGTQWFFVPSPGSVPNQTLQQPILPSCQAGAIDYQPLQGDAAAQDFVAVLSGDCSGNWQPASGGGASLLTAGEASVAIGPIRRRHGHHGNGSLEIPVVLSALRPVHAAEIQLRYDRAHARMRRVVGPKGALLAVNETSPGTIAVALASDQPLASGTLLSVELAARRASTRRWLRVIGSNLE